MQVVIYFPPRRAQPANALPPAAMTLFYEAVVAPFYASADNAFAWARNLTDWNLQAGRSFLAAVGSARRE